MLQTPMRFRHDPGRNGPFSMSTTDDMIQLCRQVLAEMLRISPDEIRPDDTFAGLGLDSAAAVHFILSVEQRTGIELEPGVTDEHPSVEAFARFVAGLRAKTSGL